MNVRFKADDTKRADDLFAAYVFIDSNQLNLENVKKAHSILSSNLLQEKLDYLQSLDFLLMTVQSINEE